MEYTIQELANEAKISPRTLRYYDEIGLLEPAIRKSNGRHCYGVKEILRLGEILSLKALGFSLKKIFSIIDVERRHQLYALRAQKNVLRQKQEDLKANLKMLDAMITANKGELSMDQGNMNHEVKDFRSSQEYVQYVEEEKSFINSEEGKALIENAKEMEIAFRVQVGEAYYREYIEKKDSLGLVESQNYGRMVGAAFQKLIKYHQEGLEGDSKEVQKVIEEQWKTLQMVYPKTKSRDIYFAIRNQIAANPIFTKREPLFSEFLYNAMTVFGERNFL